MTIVNIGDATFNVKFRKGREPFCDTREWLFCAAAVTGLVDQLLSSLGKEISVRAAGHDYAALTVNGTLDNLALDGAGGIRFYVTEVLR